MLEILKLVISQIRALFVSCVRLLFGHLCFRMSFNGKSLVML